jgi:hypothetical protein
MINKWARQNLGTVVANQDKLKVKICLPPAFQYWNMGCALFEMQKQPWRLTQLVSD